MKVLFSDVDGTLLFQNGEDVDFKPGDLQALQEFSEAGNLLVINSGRPVDGLVPVFQDKLTWNYIISVSGACIIDAEQKVIYDQVMDFELVKNLLEQYPEKLEVTFVTDKGFYVLGQRNFLFSALIQLESMEEIRGETLYGTSYHFQTAEESEQFKEWCLSNGYGETIEFLVNKKDVDSVKKGCSKGTALQWLKNKLGVGFEDIYAIGDAANDIDMLREVKHAFTFHDSEGEVKQECEGEVSTVEELIKSYILK